MVRVDRGKTTTHFLERFSNKAFPLSSPGHLDHLRHKMWIDEALLENQFGWWSFIEIYYPLLCLCGCVGSSKHEDDSILRDSKEFLYAWIGNNNPCYPRAFSRSLLCDLLLCLSSLPSHDPLSLWSCWSKWSNLSYLTLVSCSRLVRDSPHSRFGAKTPYTRWVVDGKSRAQWDGDRVIGIVGRHNRVMPNDFETTMVGRAMSKRGRATMT